MGTNVREPGQCHTPLKSVFERRGEPVALLQEIPTTGYGSYQCKVAHCTYKYRLKNRFQLYLRNATVEWKEDPKPSIANPLFHHPITGIYTITFTPHHSRCLPADGGFYFLI
jgi:hypothetical protein